MYNPEVTTEAPPDGGSPAAALGAANAAATDEELERGILEAVALGALDVARVLSGQLEARRLGRASDSTRTPIVHRRE